MSITPRQYGILRKLHQHRARHQSHYQFVTSCLRQHVIPKGLQIRVVPLVPRIKALEHTLQQKWTNTLKKTSYVLLKHLKTYHRLSISTLTHEIANLEARLRTNANFNHHRGCILRDTEKLTATYDKKKKNKLLKLLGNRKKRTRRRKTKRTSNNDDAKSTVINISNVALSKDEETLLSRGLSFCPRPSKIERFRLIDDIKQFSRRLRLREYFYDSDTNDNNDDDKIPFKRKSIWTPPPDREPALETYIETVKKQIISKLDQGPRHRSRDNISSQERKALSTLRSRTDIVIKPADKGSATVVMSLEDYLTKVMCHLNNDQFYEKLQHDPTEQFSDDITSLLADMFSRRVIDKHTLEFLRPRDVRTSRFYVLPKIHKAGVPGRPIVSSCGCPTEKISLFVDYHLNPLVRNVPSFIKDTNDFLCKLQDLQNIPPNSLLVTLDVSSLYTNIPHDEGIEACREALNSREVLSPPTEDIINLISSILTKNNFTFDDQHYLQVHGTAMGTRMAPSYANLFMGKLERDLLSYTTNIPSSWWRYIDDIFAIWPHGERNLEIFLNELNSFHPTIKFTAEWSKESVTFLDTRVINKEGRLTTDLYTKPTDTHQYLHRSSCHPPHCKKSIAYSQALRLRRICDQDLDFQRHITNLKTHLVQRGYDDEEVQLQLNKASGIKRSELLTPRPRKAQQITPFVVTFHPDLPHLSGVLRECHCLIDLSPQLKGAFPQPPLVVYRRPPNLRSLLVKAALKQPREKYKGNERCGQPRCKVCTHIKTGVTFHSSTTNQEFRVKATADCRTKNVVYLIQCAQCSIQYIGETENALRVRLTLHQSDINHLRLDRPVAHHFNQLHHSLNDLKIMVVEKNPQRGC